jgi:hypothetical protein
MNDECKGGKEVFSLLLLGKVGEWSSSFLLGLKSEGGKDRMALSNKDVTQLNDNL